MRLQLFESLNLSRVFLKTSHLINKLVVKFCINSLQLDQKNANFSNLKSSVYANSHDYFSYIFYIFIYIRRVTFGSSTTKTQQAQRRLETQIRKYNTESERFSFLSKSI